MGVLDDAIREHLDLKRQRGADPTEVEKLEQEALGPVRREPVRGGMQFDDPQEPAHADQPAHDPPGVEAHSDYHDSTAPHWQADHFEAHLDDTNGFAAQHEEVVEPKQPKRRGFLRRRSAEPVPEIEPEPRVVEAEHFWPDEYDDTRHPLPENYQPAEHYEPDHFPPGHFESATVGHGEHPTAYVGDSAELPHDASPATELHEVVNAQPFPHPLDDAIDPAPVSGEDHNAVAGSSAPHDVEAGATIDQIAVPDAVKPEPESAASYEPEPSAKAEPELVHPLGPIEPARSEALAAIEPEAPPRSIAEEPLPGGPAIGATRDDLGEPPPLTFENPPRRPRFSTEPPGMATGRSSDEFQRTSEFDVQEHMEDELAKEDVLEETPEFLQDTPEHDRLWFEQRPPRDFDFDG